MANKINNKGAIVQIADYGAPYAGNFISSLLCLHEAVATELKVDTVFVFPESARQRPWITMVQNQKIPVLFIDKSMRLVKRLQALHSIAESSNALLLHSHFTEFDLDATWVAHRMRIKSVWHVHSKLHGRYKVKQRMKDLLKMRMVAKSWVDRIVPVSDAVAENVRRRGCSDSKITTIYNGIDLARIQKNAEQTRAGLRKCYNILEGQRVFLMFGWDPKRKGVDLLAQAAQLLGESDHTKILCLIVCEDKDKALVSQMIGDHAWIRIISPVENVIELYTLADCFVSASRSEGFPYSLGEAMAAGLPIVSSDILPVTYYKSAGEGFLTFKNEDVHALADFLKYISKASSEKLRQWGELNRKFIEQNLTVERWCEKMMGLYYSVLKA